MAVLHLCSRALVVVIIAAFDRALGSVESGLQCNAGFGRSVDANCVPCLAGSYALPNGTSECLPCPAGTFAAGPQAESCSACVGASYSSSGQSACTECGDNTVPQYEARKEIVRGSCSSAEAGPSCSVRVVVGPHTALRLYVGVEQTDFDSRSETVTSVMVGGHDVPHDPIEHVQGDFYGDYWDDRISSEYYLDPDDDATTDQFRRCGYFLPVVSEQSVEAEWIDGEWVLDVVLTASGRVDANPCDGLYLNVQVEVEVTRPLRSAPEDCGCEDGYGWNFGRTCAEAGGVEAAGLGTCFFVVEEAASFEGAVAQCAGLGAQLASILSSEENQAVTEVLLANAKEQAWIGLEDGDFMRDLRSSEGNFQWIDGSARPFSNWGSNEPNDALENEDCAIVRDSGTWHDVSCDRNFPVLCSMRPGRPPVGGACIECQAGTYSAGSICQPCPAGTFSTGAGATACEACAGASFAAAGASSCSTCAQLRSEPRTEVRELECRALANPSFGASCATAVAVGMSTEVLLTVKVDALYATATSRSIRFVRVGGEEIAFTDVPVDRNAPSSACGVYFTTVHRRPVQAQQINGEWWVDVQVGATRDDFDAPACGDSFLSVLVEVEAIVPLRTSPLDCEVLWGAPDLVDACAERRSWRELALAFDVGGDQRGMFTGGLGRLMLPELFESWVCLRGHPCLADDRVKGSTVDAMCFVFDEQAATFVPWGKASTLHLIDTSPPLPGSHRRSLPDPSSSEGAGDGAVPLLARLARAERLVLGREGSFETSLPERIAAVEQALSGLLREREPLEARVSVLEAALGLPQGQ